MRDPIAAEVQLSWIIRTVLIVPLSLCNLLWSWVAYAPSQFSAIAGSESCGGLSFGWQHPFRWSWLHYRQGVHQQTGKVIHTWYCMWIQRWDYRLKRDRKYVWRLIDYVCLWDTCESSNFLFSTIPGLQLKCWSFELMEKYETAVSLRLAVAVLLWTKTETAINLSEKKMLHFKSCKWVRPWNRSLEISLATSGCE